MAPNRIISIIEEEPRALIEVAEKLVNFLVDTGAACSVLRSYSGPLSPKTNGVAGATGDFVTERCTYPLCCLWCDCIFSHSFLVMGKCPYDLLGRDLFRHLKASVSLGQPGTAVLFVQTQDQELVGVNPLVWANGTPGRALKVNPMYIQLKDPSHFPNRRQNILKPEAREGLQPILDRL